MDLYKSRVLTALYLFLQTVICDYSCVCNYNVEKAVFPSKSEQAQPIGYMYEFDCKYQIGTGDGDKDWISIGFEHQIGYIKKDGQIMIQICAGSRPDEDLVTTPPPPLTTTHFVTSSTTKLSTPEKPTVSTIVTKPTSTSVQSTKSTLPTPSSTVLPSTTSVTPSTIPASTTIPSTTINSTKFSVSYSSSITIQTTKLSTPVTSPNTVSSSHMTLSTLTRASTTRTTTHTAPTTATTSNSPSTSTTQQTTLKSTTVPPIVTTTLRPIQTTIDTTPSCAMLLKDVISKDNATLFAYGDKCLELLYIHTTWVNAELECRRKGGHLIEIDNSIEQRVVHQVIDTYYHESVWIGLHDRHHEERFEWTSGKNVVYTNWYPGRLDPNNHWKEDCVAMALNKYSGRWEDRDCSENRGFICQFGRHTLKLPVLIG